MRIIVNPYKKHYQSLQIYLRTANHNTSDISDISDPLGRLDLADCIANCNAIRLDFEVASPVVSLFNEASTGEFRFPTYN